MIRLMILFALACAIVPVASARAEIGAIPGWTRVNDDSTVLMTSPADGNGYQVAYLVAPVTPVSGNAEAWFREMTASTLEGAGTIFNGSGLVYDQDILNEVIHVRRDDGTEIYTYFAAYPTPRGYQLLVLFYPLALSEQDPRVQTALDYVTASWRSKFTLTSASTQLLEAGAAQAPAPPPEEPAAQSSDAVVGEGCRREPVWGFRISPWCQPSGICNDRVIKGYETVCD